MRLKESSPEIEGWGNLQTDRETPGQWTLAIAAENGIRVCQMRPPDFHHVAVCSPAGRMKVYRQIKENSRRTNVRKWG